EKFIAAINEHKPGLVGLSALLTTTAPMMRVIVNAFQAAGVRDEVKVLVGGAAVSQEFADEIGADGYAPDAGAAVRKAKELLAVAA
ncbi:MAG: cobalamin-dependent protein, partial [Caldilineaceae bacterium]|nr:cobalamin-dependent protein [Caldilineaceae bacterium]